VFDDASHGILAAMENLNLHFVGLPGARLPNGFKLPEKYKLCCFAKGGPSYSSCAAVWKSGCNFVVVPDVGSDRRLWFRYDPGLCTSCLYVCVMYLPAGPDGAQGCDESRWFLEVQGLGSDLKTLFHSVDALKAMKVVLMGDINVQPPELGGHFR
jgi:hypothetical protein